MFLIALLWILLLYFLMNFQKFSISVFHCFIHFNFSVRCIKGVIMETEVRKRSAWVARWVEIPMMTFPINTELFYWQETGALCTKWYHENFLTSLKRVNWRRWESKSMTEKIDGNLFGMTRITCKEKTNYKGILFEETLSLKSEK